MGRFPNIAAAKAKTGAAKGKLYGMYAKEIYQAAKSGGVTPEGNPALKRLIDINKKAKTNGLPDLVEGIFGGYSSFRLDTTGKLTNIAVMSKVNKQKIAGLLEITKGSNLTKDKIVSMDDAYLRYQLTDRRDKSINMDYLNLLIKNILADEKVRRQPLKFLPYIEGKCAGIDVVLESQLKGISQLPEFYKQKYNIAPKKTMNARIDRIENFIEM